MSKDNFDVPTKEFSSFIDRTWKRKCFSGFVMKFKCFLWLSLKSFSQWLDTFSYDNIVSSTA